SIWSDLRALLQQALAHEELERRPGAAARLEHAVDLPFRQERRVGAARVRPVAELRQPSEAARKLGALGERPLEPLLPHRHVEARLAERARKRAEGVPVERLRRKRPAPLVEVACRRRPAELGSESPQLLDELLT